MLINFPESCSELVQAQCGVITRHQALTAGMSADAIGWRLRSGRWQSLQPGVYLTVSGEPARETQLWAAVKSAGTGAMLSHETAAELFGLIDKPSPLVHVTIPQTRRVRPESGMVIHRSSRAVDALHPTLLPPRTRIDETVIDLINQAGTFDKAFATATAACQRGLVKPELLVMAMGKRKKLRWRVELGEALQQIKAGIHSMLEYRYLHLVERPHRLPTADRQARISTEDRRRYLDNLYREYRLCVELDGQSAHPDQQRWEDLRRINAIAAIGITTLRYGWADINNWPCQTAGQIAVVLNRLGWPGTVRRCAPGCLAPLAAAREAGRRRS